MFGDSFFKKVENKTKVDKNTILSLANKLQSSNMKDEKVLRELVDDISNLTPLCPNCHREVHHNLIDVSLLKSIETLYGDEWKKHYFNSENEWVHPSNFLELKRCPECGRYIPKFNKTFCSVECHQNHYKKLSKLPSIDELTKDVNTLKLADVARKYNVSHTQIARWCKKLNITRPVRGNK